MIKLGGIFIRIGYLSTIYHTSFILKNEPLRNLSDYNLEWTLFSTGPAMKDAFVSNDIDLGYIGLPPIMIGIENGLKVKCVGGGHVEGTVMVASNSYKTFDELGNIKEVLRQFEGKSIGAPSKGCIHDVIIREFTKDLDIEIKNYSWADFMSDAIFDGEIAASVGTPSFAILTLKKLAFHIVIPPTNLWPYNPSYGIVARNEIIDEYPEFIIDFLKAHEDASNLIRNEPDNAADIAVDEIEVLSKDFVLKTYNVSPKYCASVPKEYIKSTLKFVPVLKNLGYINSGLKEEDIFDTRFIEEIHPESSHYDSI
ncbi:MAG: ABC transporter substrate-binding protein [Methanobacterium sp.]|nr:ABC transporter substrate-binding protein [Methanobacterium sp.]